VTPSFDVSVFGVGLEYLGTGVDVLDEELDDELDDELSVEDSSSGVETDDEPFVEAARFVVDEAIGTHMLHLHSMSSVMMSAPTGLSNTQMRTPPPSIVVLRW
jgi:hypothetical protein